MGADETYVWRPNITGETRKIFTDGGSTASGAFSDSEAFSITALGGGNQQFRRQIFNAHSSNAIYTDNGKVYPASIALNFIIKA